MPIHLSDLSSFAIRNCTEICDMVIKTDFKHGIARHQQDPKTSTTKLNARDHTKQIEQIRQATERRRTFKMNLQVRDPERLIDITLSSTQSGTERRCPSICPKKKSPGGLKKLVAVYERWPEDAVATDWQDRESVSTICEKFARSLTRRC